MVGVTQAVGTAENTVGVGTDPSQWKSSEGQRVVLFDLDGTLMKSEEARADAWTRALRRLDGIVHCNEKARLAAYRAIYNCHASITGRVGPRGHVFEDMRQEWNTRMSYALLVAWSEDFSFFRGADPDVNEYTQALKDLLENDSDASRLLARAEEISDPWSIKHAVAIDHAIAEFWEGDWSAYLYDQVKEILHELRRQDIEYCVATEGHVPTQWRKICAVGLDQPDPDDKRGRPWLKPEQLLATSQAAQPQRDMRALVGLVEWYRGRAAANREAATTLPAGSESRSQLELAAEAAELISTGLDRIAGLFKRMASKLHVDPGRHVRPEFYIRVLYAINQAPDHARDRLAQFDFTWNQKRRIRLAMIGDNHPNDIGPVVQLAEGLNKKIMSIWVKQGSKGTAEIPHEPGWELKWAECDTIKEVSDRYLLNPEEWRARTDCLAKPMPMFASAIEPADPENMLELQSNITELFSGVSGVRNDFDQSQKNAPDRVLLEQARRFVQKVMDNIMADIGGSKSKDIVLDRALVIPKEMRDTALYLEIPALPTVVAEFLLSVVVGGSSAANGSTKNEECLQVLADLLLDHKEWAAAVVRVMHQKPDVLRLIKNSPALKQRYVESLGPITRSRDLPPGFPISEANTLYGALHGRELAASTA